MGAELLCILRPIQLITRNARKYMSLVRLTFTHKAKYIYSAGTIHTETL